MRFSARAAEYAETDHYELDGATSPVGWIKSECHMSGYAAGQRICVGEQLDKLPPTPASAAELDSGGIGFAHLALIASTSQALSESPTAKGFCEARLLAKARDASVLRFRNACAHYRHAQDPEGYAREEADAVEARFLELSARDDGCMFLKGFLDSEGAATVRTALEPLAGRQGAADDRLRTRRLGDALVELCGQSLNSGRLPQKSGVRPHLQITASLETLLRLPGSPAAELEHGAPLSGQALERIACDCSVTRVILDSKSMVIDLGRAKRLPSSPVRRALDARDRGCRVPGCTRSATWCVPHHLVHWIQNGPTDLSNLALVCYRHHLLLHEGGWSAHFAPDGSFVMVPPSANLFKPARAPDWPDAP